MSKETSTIHTSALARDLANKSNAELDNAYIPHVMNCRCGEPGCINSPAAHAFRDALNDLIGSDTPAIFLAKAAALPTEKFASPTDDLMVAVNKVLQDQEGDPRHAERIQKLRDGLQAALAERANTDGIDASQPDAKYLLSAHIWQGLHGFLMQHLLDIGEQVGGNPLVAMAVAPRAMSMRVQLTAAVISVYDAIRAAGQLHFNEDEAVCQEVSNKLRFALAFSTVLMQVYEDWVLQKALQQAGMQDFARNAVDVPGVGVVMAPISE